MNHIQFVLWLSIYAPPIMVSTRIAMIFTMRKSHQDRNGWG